MSTSSQPASMQDTIMNPRIYFHIALLVMFLVGLFPTGSSAQNSPQMDSILTILKRSKEDTSRMDQLITLSTEYSKAGKFDTTRHLLDQALSLANTLMNKGENETIKVAAKKGVASCYNNLGITYEIEGNYPLAIEYYEKSIKIARELDDQNGIAQSLGNIGLVHYYQSDYPKALELMSEALRIHEKLQDKKEMQSDLGNIGVIYSAKSEFDKAIESYNKAIKLAEERSDLRGVSLWTTNIGIVYAKQGDFPRALEYYLKSLKIDEDRKDSSGIQHSFNEIGLLYWENKDYTKALEYHFKALAIAGKMHDKRSESISLGNIGIVYSDQRVYDKAMDFLNRALKISRELGDDYSTGRHLGNIGNIHKELKEFDKALEYYVQALAIAESIEYMELKANVLGTMGSVYSSQSKFDKAEVNLLSAIQIADSIDALSLLQEYHKELSVVYEKTGRFKQAFEQYKLYTIFKDSVFSEENKKEITRKQMNFDFEKKEAAMKAQNEKAAALASQRSVAQRNQLIIAGGSVIFIGLLLYYFQRKRSLYRFKQRISEVQQEALNAQMSDHFVGNTMNSINNFIENNEKGKASEYLLLFHRLIRKVLKNSFERTIPLKEELEVLQDYLKLESLQFKEGQLNYVIQVDERIDPENLLLPPMIFQVLVENSLKHAFSKEKGGRLLIKIRKNDQLIQCEVEDDGRGRNLSMASKASEETVSFGTDLAEKLVHVFGGKYGKSTFEIIDLQGEGEVQTGTRVVFSIPFVEAA